MSIAKQSVIVGLALLPCFGLALAGSFSTKWSIRNSSAESVSLRCENTSPNDLAISLRTQPIAAGATEVHDWGDAYYNDGMGLNPGTWACSAVDASAKVITLAPFTTTWGEAVELNISGDKGGLVLSMSHGAKAPPQKASRAASPKAKASRS